MELTQSRRWRQTISVWACALVMVGCGGSDSAAPASPAPVSALPADLLVRGAVQLGTGTPSGYATNAAQDLGDLVYSWDFGDGAISSAARPSHAYAASGRYTVRVTVRNGAGTTRSAAVPVWVDRDAGVNGISCAGADRSGWCYQNLGLGGNFWFVDNHTGWTTAADQILSTADGGATWVERFKYPYGRFGKVRFVSPRVGYVLADRALEATSLFKTTDGGNTWQQIVLPDPRITGDLTVINADKLIFSGLSGLPPWASNDGGITWTIIDEPARFVAYSNQFDAVDGFANGSLFGQALDTDGKFRIVKSTDAGRTFALTPGQPSGSAVSSFVSDLQGWSLDGTGPGGVFPLWRTIDGAATWQVVGTSGLPTALSLDESRLRLNRMSFLNANDGFIELVGPQPDRFSPGPRTYYLTADGGRNWTKQLPPPGVDPARAVITPLSSRLLTSSYFAASGPSYSVSRDAGLTWATTTELPGYALRDESTLFTTTFPQHRSVDAGMTWKALVAGRPTFPDSATTFRGTNLQTGDTVQFSATHWLAMNGDGLISRTRDGGRSWTLESPSIPASAAQFAASPFVDLHFVTPSVGWFMREGRVVFKTVDGGASWTAQPVSPVPDAEPPRPAAAHFLDPQHGWVASAPYPSLRPPSMSEASYASVGTVMRRTRDGGNTWVSAGHLPFQVTSLRFVDGSNGIAVGPGGAIASTSDGGTTWTPRPAPTVKNLTRVHWIDATTALAFAFTNNGDINGMSAALLRSTDAGATWQDVPLPRLPADGWLADATFATPREGWIVGSYGTVLMTTDGGASWLQQNVPSVAEHLVSARAESARQVTVIGNTGLVLATTTGGQ